MSKKMDLGELAISEKSVRATLSSMIGSYISKNDLDATSNSLVRILNQAVEKIIHDSPSKSADVLAKALDEAEAARNVLVGQAVRLDEEKAKLAADYKRLNDQCLVQNDRLSNILGRRHAGRAYTESLEEAAQRVADEIYRLKSASVHQEEVGVRLIAANASIENVRKLLGISHEDIAGGVRNLISAKDAQTAILDAIRSTVGAEPGVSLKGEVREFVEGFVAEKKRADEEKKRADEEQKRANLLQTERDRLANGKELTDLQEALETVKGKLAFFAPRVQAYDAAAKEIAELVSLDCWSPDKIVEGVRDYVARMTGELHRENEYRLNVLSSLTTLRTRWEELRQLVEAHPGEELLKVVQRRLNSHEAEVARLVAERDDLASGKSATVQKLRGELKRTEAELQAARIKLDQVRCAVAR